MRSDGNAATRLAEAAESARSELPAAKTTRRSLPGIGRRGGAPTHVEMKLTRPEMAHVGRPKIGRCRQPGAQTLHGARAAQRCNGANPR